jgi:hypothetical protein
LLVNRTRVKNNAKGYDEVKKQVKEMRKDYDVKISKLEEENKKIKEVYADELNKSYVSLL